jgi:putative transposase
MLFHVWFSTKKRREALQGEIRESVLSSFRRIAADKHIALIEVEGQFDHVHMLPDLSAQTELPNTLRLLKGISSRELTDEYPYLTMTMGTLAFWQKGYGRRSVPEAEREIVRHYIRTQIERPLRHVE